MSEPRGRPCGTLQVKCPNSRHFVCRGLRASAGPMHHPESIVDHPAAWETPSTDAMKVGVLRVTTKARSSRPTRSRPWNATPRVDVPHHGTLESPNAWTKGDVPPTTQPAGHTPMAQDHTMSQRTVVIAPLRRKWMIRGHLGWPCVIQPRPGRSRSRALVWPLAKWAHTTL